MPGTRVFVSDVLIRSICAETLKFRQNRELLQCYTLFQKLCKLKRERKEGKRDGKLGTKKRHPIASTFLGCVKCLCIQDNQSLQHFSKKLHLFIVQDKPIFSTRNVSVMSVITNSPQGLDGCFFMELYLFFGYYQPTGDKVSLRSSLFS